MIEELIGQWAESLKAEEVYKAYLQAEKGLEKQADLLERYKKAKEVYLEMKPYEKYQDLSALKKAALELAEKVEALPEWQTYHRAKSALDERLARQVELVFGDLIKQKRGEGCAGHCG